LFADAKDLCEIPTGLYPQRMGEEGRRRGEEGEWKGSEEGEGRREEGRKGRKEREWKRGKRRGVEGSVVESKKSLK